MKQTYTRTTVAVVAVCLALVVAGMVPAVAAPDRTAANAAVAADPTRTASAGAGSPGPAADITPVPSGALAISNDDLALYVGDDGTYTLQTVNDEGENIDLLYGSGSPWSSYLTVVVDDQTYVTRDGGMNDYVTRSPTVVGDSIVAEWTLPEGVVVTQTITLDGELATFDVAAENTNPSPVDVRARFLFDYQVVEQDGSPVWLEGQVINTETAFDDPAFDSWKTYDQVPTPTFTGQARLLTQPDRVAFVSWPWAYDAAYEYEVTPGLEFYDIEAEDGDSAGLVYFDFGTVAGGESASAATQYGVGEPGTATETLNLVFENQSTVNGTSVTVDSVFLPEAGFLGVYAGPDTTPASVVEASTHTENVIEEGTLLGSSPYLTAGSHEDIVVPLSPALTASQELTVVPFRDTNGNGQPDLGTGDEPYTTNGTAVTQTATVTVGSAPTADAGVDVSVTEDETVSLDGTNSTDPEGDSLAYEWSQTGGPDVSLDGADTATPTFTAPGVDAPTGLTFELTVTDGQGNADTDGVTVTVVPEDGPEPPTATVTFENQSSDGTTVTVDSVTMSEGGFVAIHNDSLFDGDALGSVVGVSEYLPAGAHDDVEVTLFDVDGANFSANATLTENTTLVAMPHLDTNGNGVYDFVSSEGAADGPYTANGQAVVDDAYVTVEGEQPPSETTYYQVDFVAGEPMESLSADTLYAEQDRLVRWALGNTDDGVTDRGTGWASQEVRSCVDRAGAVTVEGGVATLSFAVNESCSDVQMSLVSYTTPASGFSPETADQQELYGATTETFGPGEHTITVELPEADDGNETLDVSGLRAAVHG